MEIVKSIAGLGLVLLVLTSTAAASAEGDLYWAVSHGCEDVREPDGYALFPLCRTYGAAWGFASLEDAEAAAVAECRKQKQPNQRCTIAGAGKSSCFFIRRLDGIHGGAGPWTSFTEFGPYSSRAEAQAAAKRDVDTHPYEDSQNTGMVATIELVECAGVE